MYALLIELRLQYITNVVCVLLLDQIQKAVVILLIFFPYPVCSCRLRSVLLEQRTSNAQVNTRHDTPSEDTNAALCAAYSTY